MRVRYSQPRLTLRHNNINSNQRIHYACKTQNKMSEKTKGVIPIADVALPNDAARFAARVAREYGKARKFLVKSGTVPLSIAMLLGPSDQTNHSLMYEEVRHSSGCWRPT